MSTLKKRRQPLQLNLYAFGSVRLPWAKDCSLDNLGKETSVAYFNNTVRVLRHQKREKHMISSPLLLCNSLHNLFFTLNMHFSRFEAEVISSAGFTHVEGGTLHSSSS